MDRRVKLKGAQRTHRLDENAYDVLAVPSALFPLVVTIAVGTPFLGLLLSGWTGVVVGLLVRWSEKVRISPNVVTQRTGSLGACAMERRATDSWVHVFKREGNRQKEALRYPLP
jgi:hypothetical protein